MNRIDRLAENYGNHMRMPLQPGLPASQRVWFAVYPAEDERRLVNRIDEFDMLTRAAGHPWARIDLACCFADWLDSIDEEERAIWFAYPDSIDLYAANEWKGILSDFVKVAVARVAEPDRTVFALTGLMELFDFIHVSELIGSIEEWFPGYLLVFFPGERDGNTYRFLDARTGWNYQAVPILSEK